MGMVTVNHIAANAGDAWIANVSGHTQPYVSVGGGSADLSGRFGEIEVSGGADLTLTYGRTTRLTVADGNLPASVTVGAGATVELLLAMSRVGPAVDVLRGGSVWCLRAEAAAHVVNRGTVYLLSLAPGVTVLSEGTFVMTEERGLSGPFTPVTGLRVTGAAPAVEGSRMTASLTGAAVEITWWVRDAEGRITRLEADGASYTPVEADIGREIIAVARGTGGALGASVFVSEPVLNALPPRITAQKVVFDPSDPEDVRIPFYWGRGWNIATAVTSVTLRDGSGAVTILQEGDFEVEGSVLTVVSAFLLQNVTAGGSYTIAVQFDNAAFTLAEVTLEVM
jgi:hypothetical protein